MSTGFDILPDTGKLPFPFASRRNHTPAHLSLERALARLLVSAARGKLLHVGVECDVKRKRLRFSGENIVNAADLQHYRRLLLAKRDELSATRDEAAALVPPAGDSEGDLMDRASADTEAELQVRVHQSDAHLVRAIDESLARIRRGTFGVCESCQQPISKARLEAVPWTRLCRECKEQQHA